MAKAKVEAIGPYKVASDLQQLKRNAGRAPFERRLNLDASGFCACPFHTGDSDKSLHLFQNRHGLWAVTCFSACKHTWGPIDFVMKFDNVDFKEAVERLGGKDTVNPIDGTHREAPKPKPKAMKRAEYAAWGRELTPEDVERFAKSRKGKTPSFGELKNEGCRVKDDYIGFPQFHPNGDLLYELKMRHMDRKEFIAEHSVSSEGFFNLDTMSCFEDLYVVEGELDAGVLQEAGYCAVSVRNGSQTRFDKHALKVISEALRIFLVGDFNVPRRGKDDDPGETCMETLQKALLPVQEKVYRFRFHQEDIDLKLKDVGDLAAHYDDGFTEKFEQLKKEALNRTWVTENIPFASQLSKEPVRWTIDRIIPYGGLVMITAERGSMKTLLAMFIAKYLSKPMPDECFGRKVLAPSGGLPVLYLDRENSQAEVNHRLTAMGVIVTDRLHYWGDWSEHSIPDEPDDPNLLQFASHKKGLVIFDSLQDWYGDVSEIDNTGMAQVMHKFKRLARAGAGVVVLHDIDKAAMSKWRGAGVIIGLSDMALSINKIKEPTEEGYTLLELEAIKFRQCAPWEMDLKVSFNQLGQGFYGIGVARDELVSDVIKRENAEKKHVRAEKKAAREASRNEETETLNNLIAADPTLSKTALEKETGVDRDRIGDLVKEKWAYNPKAQAKGSVKWTRASDSESDPIFNSIHD